MIELWSKVHPVQELKSKLSRTMIPLALKIRRLVVMIVSIFKVVRKTRTISMTNLVVFVQTKMMRANFTMH